MLPGPQGFVGVASSMLSWPIQNPTAGGISLDNLPLTQLILGAGNGLTDAQVAVTSLKGRNAYERSSTDKPGSALILSGGIGRRFVTIVDYSLIDSGVDTVTLTLGSISTGSYVSTATVITAGTGWVPATSNAVTAAALATYINTLGLSVTASASGDICYIAPKPDLISFTLATSMAAGEGTVTSGTDGITRIGVGGELSVAAAAITTTVPIITPNGTDAALAIGNGGSGFYFGTNAISAAYGAGGPGFEFGMGAGDFKIWANVRCDGDGNRNLGATGSNGWGNLYLKTALYMSSTKILGAQGAAVADASGGAIIDAEARTALNALLARLRTHGLIAT